ncbi:MAG: RAD55 family ATPase [Candidatus Kariarchaeaceae archaeon]|jgi:KaiC/GvpD/RAD55 family RecA-like ATPase
MSDDQPPSPKDKDIHYPTGMTVLDQKFSGDEMDDSKKGIPGGSLILIHAPPQTNLATLFAQKVLLNCLETVENAKAYYMHSSRPRHIIEKEFDAYNWDYSKFQAQNRWEFVDMWHITSSHTASSSKIGKIDIRRKTYLKQAFKKMIQVHENENVTCFSVVDNLLWLKEEDFDREPSRILEFFKDLTDIIVHVGGVHFFVLPKGILYDVTENMISSVVNGIIDFDRYVSGTRNQDRLSVVKMMGVSYSSDILDITPDHVEGLRIESTGKI